MEEIYIVIKDGSHDYYLLKVEKRDLDVYCFMPNLGYHYSLHESGESHFQHEKQPEEPLEQPPVILMMGEAGTLVGKSIIRSTLKDIGHASGICSAIYSITSLSQDFREFNRNLKECFMIDKSLLPKDTEAILVGVWAVPKRNQASFDFNNPNIPEEFLYKITDCEPQIWIFACPV